MSDLLSTLHHHLLEHTSPDPQIFEEVETDATIAALAAIDTHGAVREIYLDRYAPTWGDAGPIETLAIAASERPEREEALDDRLDGEDPAAVAIALARAATLWEHDAFFALLEDDRAAARASAACLLAQVDPEGLLDWLHYAEEPGDDALRDIARALSLHLEVPLDGGLSDIWEALEELDEDEDLIDLRDATEAAIAVAAPLDWARGVMAGDFSFRWLRDPARVADFLVTYGETSWLEALALLEIGESRDAFEFAALLAVAASAALPAADAEVDPEALHNLMESARDPQQKGWEPAAVAAGFKVAVALGGENMSELLVQVAAHERLILAELPSPGVAGLPLSTTDEDQLNFSATRELFADVAAEAAPDDEVIAATVKTLCDLRALHAREVPTVGPMLAKHSDVLDTLCEHDVRAINLAARRLMAQLYPSAALVAPQPQAHADAVIAGIDTPAAIPFFEEIARGEGVAALWSLHELSELPLEDALAPMARAWSEGSVWRGTYTKTVLQELVFSVQGAGMGLR